MDLLVIAVILGLVEGITEFLPISSTGHLILVGDALNFLGDKAGTFEIVIQSGAILAVLVLYKERFLGLLKPAELGDSFRGISGISKLACACAPAMFLGFILHKSIKFYLFNPASVATALIVGGLVMLWLEHRRPAASINSLETITHRTAFLIGCFQCFALWPGISRSGATIVGAMLLGAKRAVAAEFSFLIATPILLAATAYELYKSFHLLSASDLPVFLMGFFVSFISALLAVKAFVRILSHWSLVPFAIYRIALGAVVLLMVWR
jgi:undecaprenyl-diphosphatase